MDVKKSDNVVALTADTLILNQCARMLDSLCKYNNLFGDIFSEEAIAMQLEHSGINRPVKPEQPMRPIISAFIRQAADEYRVARYDDVCIPQIRSTIERDDWCIIQPIHFKGVLIGIASIYPIQNTTEPPPGLQHIAASLYWFTRLAVIQRGGGLNEITPDDVESPFATDRALLQGTTQTTGGANFTELFPVLGKLIGSRTFTEKAAETIRMQLPDRLLAVTVIRVYIHDKIGTPITGTLHMELLDNVVSRLSGTMRQQDLICYLPNGDFGMLVSPIPTPALADPIFTRLLGSMTQAVVRDGKLYAVSFNAGIILVNGNHTVNNDDVREYMSKACLLLDNAINQGNNQRAIMHIDADAATYHTGDTK